MVCRHYCSARTLFVAPKFVHPADPPLHGHNSSPPSWPRQRVHRGQARADVYSARVITDLRSFTTRRPRYRLGTLFAVGEEPVLTLCWSLNQADWQPLWHLQVAWPADLNAHSGPTLVAVRAGTAYRHPTITTAAPDNPELLILARNLDEHHLPTTTPCCITHAT